jgi:hypothetical protein
VVSARSFPPSHAGKRDLDLVHRGRHRRSRRARRRRRPAVGTILVDLGHAYVTTPSISTEEDEQQIELIGNQWAPLFAAGRTPGCNVGEGLIVLIQPLCERIACQRAGGVKIRNCTRPTSAFRDSFAEATVQDIEIKGNPTRAAARFSNGEVIELIEWGSSWAIAELGGNAGSTFFE